MNSGWSDSVMASHCPSALEQTDRQIYRQSGRQTDGHTHTHARARARRARKGERDIETDRHTNTHTYREKERQTDGQK